MDAGRGSRNAMKSRISGGNTERLEAMLYPSPFLTVKTLPIPEGVSRGELERIALTKYTNHYYITAPARLHRVAFNIINWP